jgi:O-antigen/teichoic acid export membrane protein
VDTLTHKSKSLPARIVSGSVVLLSGSGLTTAINLAYNIVVARFLGAQGFGHVTVVYTLLTLLSAVTLSFQIVSTKVVAQQDSPEERAAVYRGFHRSAWACGIAVAMVLLLFQQGIGNYLNLPHVSLIALLAIGAAFYVPLGCRRGFVQGNCGFRRLAGNLVLEGAVRFCGSLLLILLGTGVQGVIAANSAAIAVAYLSIVPAPALRIPNPLRFSYALRETVQAMVFFAGQVLINNCDIVLVKHFFSAQAAGLYAAVAMVGRVILAFSQAVINSTFPLVAGTHADERKDLKVIATSLMLVIGTGSAIAGFLCVVPGNIWTTIFGPGFEIAGRYDVSYLLAMYALTTVVYSLSAVIITFEMSYKIANTSWIQLLFSGVVIAGICRFHSSLREVILVQLISLSGLFVLVALPFLVDSLTVSANLLTVGGGRPVKLIRRVSEDEVIAEFVKSDFDGPAFRDYQDTLRDVVVNPNLEDAEENAKRRALLFIRHLALWREIPVGTKWYEVEVNESDLSEVRVFPRAQWRKLARGNFSVPRIADEMRNHGNLLDAQFLAKIASIGDRLTQPGASLGAILLIGRNENEPLTVLDGNHRLVAAMLASPLKLDRFRFLCGFSPRMTDCCWYTTNLMTLCRYGKNAIMHAVRRPEAELARLLRDPESGGAAVEA